MPRPFAFKSPARASSGSGAVPAATVTCGVNEALRLHSAEPRLRIAARGARQGVAAFLWKEKHVAARTARIRHNRPAQHELDRLGRLCHPREMRFRQHEPRNTSVKCAAMRFASGSCFARRLDPLSIVRVDSGKATTARTALSVFILILHRRLEVLSVLYLS